MFCLSVLKLQNCLNAIESSENINGGHSTKSQVTAYTEKYFHDYAACN